MKIKELDVYQKLAMRTNKDMGNKERQLEYAILSLCGEAGEMANLLKKKAYHNKPNIGHQEFKEELSDVLWYVACICDALNVNLSEIAEVNIEKLEKRYNGGGYNEAHYNPSKVDQ